MQNHAAKIPNQFMFVSRKNIKLMLIIVDCMNNVHNAYMIYVIMCYVELFDQIKGCCHLFRLTSVMEPDVIFVFIHASSQDDISTYIFSLQTGQELTSSPLKVATIVIFIAFKGYYY